MAQGNPFDMLSITTGSSPASRSPRTICPPMYPAPPVTRTVMRFSDQLGVLDPIPPISANLIAACGMLDMPPNAAVSADDEAVVSCSHVAYLSVRCQFG